MKYTIPDDVVIPDGSEQPGKRIACFTLRNFDNMPDVQTVFLAAPKSTYGTPRYKAVHAALLTYCQPTRSGGAVWQLLDAASMWRNGTDEWRETYREKLEHVSQVFVLPNADLSIGAGVWAELAYLTRESDKVNMLAAVLPPTSTAGDRGGSAFTPDIVIGSVLFTNGYFEAVPSDEWTWWNAARYRPARTAVNRGLRAKVKAARKQNRKRRV